MVVDVQPLRRQDARAELRAPVGELSADVGSLDLCLTQFKLF